MKYNELNVAASKNIKRVGRGISSGQGKTAGRGTKGQKARSGKKLRATFTGGSRSLVTAIPKAKGFKSLRTSAQVVYIDHLNGLTGKTVDNFALFNEGLITTPYHTVKVILRGELTDKINLHVAGASKSAVAAIVKAGGTFVKTAVPLKKGTKSAETIKK